MNKLKILIVEDDAEMRLALHIRLKAHGYETAFAADGLSATSMAVKETPDLILLDIGLPAGDGFVVMDRLRKHTKLAMVPVIVLSARDARGNKERALESGCCAYFQKPVDNKILVATIDQALRNSGATAHSIQ